MILRILLTVSGLAALLMGCGAHPSRQVRSDAARDWHCDTDQVDVRRRNNDTFVAVGCGRQGVFQCRDDLGEINCVNLAWMARDRAGREFGCDAFELTLDEVSPYIFRVTGCGHEATYQCQISGTVARCAADTGVAPQGEPPPGEEPLSDPESPAAGDG